MGEVKIGSTPYAGGAPTAAADGAQSSQTPVHTPVETKASESASSSIREVGSQFKEHALNGLRSIKNEITNVISHAPQIFGRIKSAVNNLGIFKQANTQTTPPQQAMARPPTPARPSPKMESPQDMQNYVNNQRLQHTSGGVPPNGVANRPPAQQGPPSQPQSGAVRQQQAPTIHAQPASIQPQRAPTLQEQHLNILNQHGAVAANHGDAMQKLQNAPMGSLCVWKSQSKPGEITMLQKTPAGMYLESLGKENLLEQVNEMHTGHGQERTLYIKGHSATDLEDAKTKLAGEPQGFFIWESKSEPGKISIIYNTSDGPKATRLLKDANLFNNISQTLATRAGTPPPTAAAVKPQHAAPAAQVAPSVVQSKPPIALASATAKELWGELTSRTQQIVHTPAEGVNGRYLDIKCEQTTAIKGGGQALHANLVGAGLGKRQFIAAQAPLVVRGSVGQPNVDQTETFWKAMLENSNTIIDLTTEADKDGPNAKSSVTEYYPTKQGESIQFGSCKVTLKSSVASPDTGTAHTYVVQDGNGQSKEITRVHYPDWVDHGKVDVSQLEKLVNMLSTTHTSDKTCIHCRAGVGRTGTLTAAYYLKEKIASGEINAGNLEDKLMETVLTLRSQRDNKFVQTQDQLDMLRGYGKKLLNLS